MRASAPMRSLGSANASANVKMQKACARLPSCGRACVVGRPSMRAMRTCALGRDDGLNTPKNDIADQLLSEASRKVHSSSGMHSDGLVTPMNSVADALLSEASKGKPALVNALETGGLGSNNVGVPVEKIGNTGSAAENVKGLKAVRGSDGTPVLQQIGGGGGSGGNNNRGGGGGGGGGSGGNQPSGGGGTPGWGKALLGAAVIGCGAFVVTTGLESMKGIQKSDVKAAKQVEAKRTEKAVKDAGNKAHSKLDDAGHKVKDTVGNLLHKGENLVHRGEDGAKHAADDLKHKAAEHEAKVQAREAEQAAKAKAKEAELAASRKAEELKQNTKNAAEEAKHGAKQVGNDIKGGAKNASDDIKNKVDKAAGVVKGKLGEIDGEQVKNAAGRTAQYLALGTSALLGAATLAASVVEGSKELKDFKRRNPQKVAKLEGQAKDAARDVKGQAQGLAKDVKGRVQGATEDVKSRAQDAAQDVKRDAAKASDSKPQTSSTATPPPTAQQAMGPKSMGAQSAGNQGSLAPHVDPKAERDARASKGVNDFASTGRPDNRMEPAPANAYQGVGTH